MNASAYLLIAFAIFFTPAANAAGPSWAGFKGIYVSQPANDFKAQGFTCHPSDAAPSLKIGSENCVPAPSIPRFSTFGGEKVTYLEAIIQDGKVLIISLKTEGAYGGGLEKAMVQQYGKPRKAKGTWKQGVWQWDKGGAEYVSLSMGNGINEVSFAIDNSSELDKKAAAKARQGRKDF